VGANTTDYVWSNSSSLPVVVYDGSYYVYGLGLIAKTDSQDGQLYYLADGLASTTGLTDGQGSVVGTYTYDVFGAVRSETGGQANDYRFTGQQQDGETAFYYLRVRHYDPVTGRFPTRDPFAGLMTMPQSLSRYPYVLNGPVTLVDPSGLWPGEGLVNRAADVAGDVIDTGADIAGDAWDAATDGYLDVNGTWVTPIPVPKSGGWGWLTVTGGIQMSLDEGVHPYAGAGVGGLKPDFPTASLTYAPGQSITTGWGCGFQGSLVSPYFVGGTFQAGAAGLGNDKEGPSGFAEFGIAIGRPGASGAATCYHVW
jgi:RHS repeat-associated protein